MPRFAYSVDTRVGHVRTNNEDSAYADPRLLVVADGVGGAAAGEVASASVTHVLSTAARHTGSAEPLDLLERAIDFAHRHLVNGVGVAKQGSDEADRSGMATTLTAILTNGEQFALAHLGDSRAYLLRDGSLSRLTSDHTLVQQLLDSGDIDAEQARTHPHRSVVTRALNARSQPDSDLLLLDLRPGDRILLCTDGLTDLVSDDRLAELASVTGREDAVAALVAAALDAGGSDNVTCVVADVEPADPGQPDGTLVGAAREAGNLIDPEAVASAVARGDL